MAGARRTPVSTTSRTPRRRGRVCLRCTERLSRKSSKAAGLQGPAATCLLRLRRKRTAEHLPQIALVIAEGLDQVGVSEQSGRHPGCPWFLVGAGVVDRDLHVEMPEVAARETLRYLCC